MKDINWDKYMRASEYEDSEKANLIFEKIAELYRFFPKNIANSKLGQLPSQDWIFQGTQDGEDPWLNVRNFYSHIQNCGIEDDN